VLEKVPYEGTQTGPRLFAESLEHGTEEGPDRGIRQQHEHGF
jgi:hypothetical protein